LAEKSEVSLKFRLNPKYLRGAIGLFITSVSIYLALREVSFDEVKIALERADYRYVWWAFLSTLGIILARVIRWRVLMGVEGGEVTLARNLMALLAGQALNLIYPARIGDISRAYFVDQSGTRRVFMLGTVVLEKLFDSLTYVLMFFVLVLLLPLPGWLSSSGYTFALLTIFSLGMVFLIAYRLEWFSGLLQRLAVHLPVRYRGKIQSWLVSGLSSLTILRSKPELAKLAVLSILIWVIPVFTNHLTLMALQINLPLIASLLTMIVLQASVAIPSVPGRIGLFQYLCVLSLSLFGVKESLAFTYGVLLHGLALLPSTLVGLIFLWFLGYHGQKPKFAAQVSDEQGDSGVNLSG
jgi:glycosyltransferase 2 family protein